MDCHEIQRNIPFLNDGTLDPRDEQEVHAHLLHCAACHQVYEEQQRMIALVHTAYPSDGAGVPHVDVLASVHRGIEKKKRMTTIRRYSFAAAAALLIAATGFMSALMNRTVVPVQNQVAETDESFYEYVADLYVNSYDMLVNAGSAITYDSEDMDPEAVLESGYVSVSVEDMITYLDADDLENVLAQTTY